MVDVKAVRGAKARSDHYLVLMKVSLKLRKPKNPEEANQPKLRVSKLEEKEVRWNFHWSWVPGLDRGGARKKMVLKRHSSVLKIM